MKGLRLSSMDFGAVSMLHTKHYRYTFKFSDTLYFSQNLQMVPPRFRNNCIANVASIQKKNASICLKERHCLVIPRYFYKKSGSRNI